LAAFVAVAPLLPNGELAMFSSCCALCCCCG
jgi:hypothetical protein